MGKDTYIKERISYLRRGRKFSQEKMASSLKISLNSYRKLENGSTRIVNQHLEKIAELLNVSSDLLLTDCAGNEHYDLYEEYGLLLNENKTLKKRILELESQISKLEEIILNNNSCKKE